MSGFGPTMPTVRRARAGGRAASLPTRPSGRSGHRASLLVRRPSSRTSGSCQCSHTGISSGRGLPRRRRPPDRRAPGGRRGRALRQPHVEGRQEVVRRVQGITRGRWELRLHDLGPHSQNVPLMVWTRFIGKKKAMMPIPRLHQGQGRAHQYRADAAARRADSEVGQTFTGPGWRGEDARCDRAQGRIRKLYAER